jgi:hypothetical protein
VAVRVGRGEVMMRRRAATLLALLLPSACGGGGAGPPPSGGSPLISVGGDYAMSVSVTENSCGPVTVMPLPTHVDHTPGATRFTLTHGGTRYEGTLAADGTFTTEIIRLSDPQGNPVTVALAGRFQASGLEGTVTITMPACRYLVRWIGVKQGAPNVIP